MQRWNGWGDTSTTHPLPAAALPLLGELLGPGTPPRDATLAAVVAGVPASRLPPHPLVVTEPEHRVRHARGQGFLDLLAMRSGRIPAFPDGVVYPRGGEEVRTLLRYAGEVGARLIPYGGGTSVVGHVNPSPGDDPVLTVDLRHLSSLHDLNEADRLANFGAGVAGPQLEARLAARGYTLGHFPQSFERSTLGGWIATRSSGQQSLGYGRIEQLFAGGTLESPAGTLTIPPFPASAAGPDLREMVLGSEGRLGLLTEATVRVSPRPQREDFHAVFFPDWDRALAAVLALAQSEAPLSMLRLSTPGETSLNLGLTGRGRLVGALRRLVALRRGAGEMCMLLIGLTGTRATVDFGRRTALGLARHHGGLHLGRGMGRQWARSRFRAPYLRDGLWESGYAVDTVETATTWSRVPAMVRAVEEALGSALAERGEPVHAFTHLSHLYPQGASVYTTFLFRLHPDPDETRDRWRLLKAAASRAVVQGGGTISHQHGVGTDHRPYLVHEKGELGIAAIRGMTEVFDPAGTLNPGKLV